MPARVPRARRSSMERVSEGAKVERCLSCASAIFLETIECSVYLFQRMTRVAVCFSASALLVVTWYTPVDSPANHLLFRATRDTRDHSSSWYPTLFQIKGKSKRARRVFRAAEGAIGNSPRLSRLREIFLFKRTILPDRRDAWDGERFYRIQPAALAYPIIMCRRSRW